MFLIILFLILTAIAVIVWRVSKQPLAGAVSGGLLALTVVVFALSCFTTVPARNIGVVTSYGKPVDVYDSGLHMKAPWEKTKELDGTIQTTSRTGSDSRPTGSENKDGDKMSCTDVKIGNGSVACVDNSVRWRIKLEAGKSLYQDYPKGMDDITDSLVKRQTTAALNDVLSKYDPLTAVKGGDQDAAVAPDLTAYAAQVKSILVENVGDNILIEDVIIPIIRLDRSTQGKINAYQAEVAQTRIAEQAVETAKKQADANDAIRKSVSSQPEVLQKVCLDILDQMVKTKQRVPVGFSCFGGGTGTTLVTPVK